MQPTTPLRHFPYENENICAQKPIMGDRYKMMTNNNPFGATNHPRDQLPADFYHPCNNVSPYSPPSNYSNYQSYGNNCGNYQQYTASSPNYQNVKTEPEEEYVEDPIQQKVTSKRKTILSVSAPRKYKKKTELEKNNPVYIQGRKRNNIAVQLSREKKKRREEAEKEAFDKLKQKYSEMENLIKQFQQEVRASRCQTPFNVFPSLEKMIHYQ
ncbi:hypothetical protein B9Z55_013967 [Caenorhabditis nigoni]|uniref:BZIP domain-containing protein n=1 Tax=Caenorhabditis nigoni TaxID=1611254 RepID=A0A2G5U409_9PELO|nr:hypothetical protein B9Z55_013967 [Caenorhabditis nigoni]